MLKFFGKKFIAINYSWIIISKPLIKNFFKIVKKKIITKAKTNLQLNIITWKIN